MCFSVLLDVPLDIILSHLQFSHVPITMVVGYVYVYVYEMHLLCLLVVDLLYLLVSLALLPFLLDISDGSAFMPCYFLLLFLHASYLYFMCLRL